MSTQNKTRVTRLKATQKQTNAEKLQTQFCVAVPIIL